MRRQLSAALAATIGAIALPVVVDAPARAAEGRNCTTDETQYVTEPAGLLNLQQTGFEQSWRFATGKGVVVAVVDSGVNQRNVHFSRGLEDGTSFVGGAGTDDLQGHGTAVAGIIGARTFGNSVLVGAAPDATIVPVRVNTVADQISTANVAKGIRWAAERDEVDVINISISTGPSDPQLKALRAATALAVKNDKVVVASAGNGPGRDNPYTQVQYPAGFPGVLGVAATTPGGGVDNYSIHGKHVDVSAPGVNVLAPFHAVGDCLFGIDQPYTSYATPFVSALAAQLRERFPKDSAADIANRITSTADRPRIAERNDIEGWGRIQPVAALTSSEATPPGERRSSIKPPAGTSITARAAADDPLAGPRDRLLWWALGATALLSVALVARPLSARMRR